MLDFHTHVLPGIDDGSKDLKTTKKMLEIMMRQGVSRIAATPHFYYDEITLDRFLERRNNAAEMVFKSIEKNNRPEIALGAEVSFFYGLEMLENSEKLCLEGTNLMLVELPFGKWDARVYSALNMLKRARDITPVVAHYDRYLQFNPLRESLDRIVETGALIQCNTSFFLGFMTRHKALRMFQSGCIQFIGSDCHNLDSRKPNYSDAVEVIYKKLGGRAIDDLGFWEHAVISDGAGFR